MNPKINKLLIAALTTVSLLSGCGKHETHSTIAPAEQGPSPYAGHDKAWFLAHPKDGVAENQWCKDNDGYINPTTKAQDKNYDPACDAASDAYWFAMRHAKTGPGAF